MHSNKKFNKKVTKLFIRGRKLNISCFKESKNVKLKTTHFFIMKIPNERELQKIVYNHYEST